LKFCVEGQVGFQVKIKTLLTDLKIANLNIRFIRCDDASENMKMKNDPKIKSFGIKFEFSGPKTPQRKGKVERKFQTLYGRIREMLNGANLEGELRDKILAKCVMLLIYPTSSQQNQILKAHLSYHMLKNPTLHNNLKVFGEVGVVTTKDKI
jgi:hypothetical protein